EGFYTRLNDVFALTENGHDEKGNLLLTRVNSAGAYVGGINIEGKVGYRKTFMLQGGVTLQRSRYLADFTWSNNPNIKPQRRMFRTPDKYGYFLVRYSPIHPLSFTVDGKVTGDMLVQHMAGYIAEDEEVQSESFFEMGAKISYEVHLYKHYTLEFSTGVKNMFNQYQKDLDRGMDKDAGYIYGPALPRTFYLGFNLKI
ncbi:MAG: TonB-dependent receptor, partial [Bacteroidaceae bacterium]|nr:TonB-dependent receptor [Bacteroidaceae bacterium]